jgi:hypothetical protein
MALKQNSFLNKVLLNAIRTITVNFENPIGLLRPLWRDYSRWQGQVDFGVAKANGVLGYAARSTISWGYQDTWFPRNWTEGRALGLFGTSYHVIYPDQSIERQLNNWFTVHPEIDIIPRVIDLELSNGCSPRQIADATWELSEGVFQREGVRPIIYSRYMLINEWLAPYWSTEEMNMHYWWLANKVSRENIIMHQTADKKPGFSGEVQSASVDWDRWEIGNKEEMHQFIAEVWGDDTPDIPDIPENPIEVNIDVFITDYAYPWMVEEGYSGPSPSV